MAPTDSNKPAVEAVITDLDGTFWSTTMAIHEKSLETVAAFDDANIPFVIATGRRAQGALLGLTPAGLQARPGILMNGALARDNLAGESFLVSGISTVDSHLALAAFRRGGVEPVVYVDHPNTDMLIGPGAAAGEGYLAGTVGWDRVESLDESVNDHPVIGFGAFGFAYDLLKPIADEINTGVATAIIGESLFEGNHGLMIQGLEVDKQTGIEAWCARTGIDPRRLAVVGDGHNDIKMLSAAHIAIVPESAAPEILEIADVIIAPNEDGGWEQIPEILNL